MNETEEVFCFSLIADGTFSKVKQPGEEAFYAPSLFIEPQLSSILGFRDEAVEAVGRNQFNTFCFEAPVQGVVVVGAVANQFKGMFVGKAAFKGLLRQGTFMRRGACHQQSKGPRRPTRHRHDLRTLALQGFTDFIPLFWQGKNCRR